MCIHDHHSGRVPWKGVHNVPENLKIETSDNVSFFMTSSMLVAHNILVKIGMLLGTSEGMKSVTLLLAASY
jgi:hypothetical protein